MTENSSEQERKARKPGLSKAAVRGLLALAALGAAAFGVWFYLEMQKPMVTPFPGGVEVLWYRNSFITVAFPEGAEVVDGPFEEGEAVFFRSAGAGVDDWYIASFRLRSSADTAIDDAIKERSDTLGISALRVAVGSGSGWIVAGGGEDVGYYVAYAFLDLGGGKFLDCRFSAAGSWAVRADALARETLRTLSVR